MRGIEEAAPDQAAMTGCGESFPWDFWMISDWFFSILGK